MDTIEMVEEIFRLLEEQQRLLKALMTTPENAAACELRAKRIKELVVALVNCAHTIRVSDQSGKAVL
jgi:hypothetical protein